MTQQQSEQDKSKGVFKLKTFAFPPVRLKRKGILNTMENL